MFLARFDPAYVEQASLKRLAYWHGRFFGVVERQVEARKSDQKTIDAITAAVKRLPGAKA